MVTREERDRGECLGRILNGQPTLSVSDPPAKTEMLMLMILVMLMIQMMLITLMMVVSSN